jgi:hypothetical protein
MKFDIYTYRGKPPNMSPPASWEAFKAMYEHYMSFETSSLEFLTDGVEFTLGDIIYSYEHDAYYILGFSGVLELPAFV